ncbi:MAG: ferrous iron transport protein A [Clostridia bacterium]|jgi:Fe2+ transport system protein FeoA|nr:ferrous iron transport protein A [Clostridia bacterium]
MTLSDLKLDEIGIINKISCSPEIKKRFLDLGFVKDTKISPVLTSPSGNIRAYLIKDTLIAIRNEDALKILIQMKTNL